MKRLAPVLLMLSGFGPEYAREIDYELAMIQTSEGCCRIQWQRHFPWLKDRLSEAQNHRCCWCGKRVEAAGSLDDRPTFEHIVALSDGGEDTPANLAVACFRCNNRRGNGDPI